MQISDTAKKIIIRIAAIFVLALAIGLILKIAPPLEYFFGLAIGSSFAAVKVVILEKALNKAVDRGSNSQLMYQGGFFVRYLATGAVLIIAAVVPGINLIACIIGILSLQVAAYTVNLRVSKNNRNSEGS